MEPTQMATRQNDLGQFAVQRRSCRTATGLFAGGADENAAAPETPAAGKFADDVG